MARKDNQKKTDEKQKFNIDECLGFIANRLVKVFHKALDKKLEGYGLTSAQFCALARLLEEEGITQTELARRLYIESPTLVRTLDKMEEANIIERRKDPSDRRAYHIYLKPKGKKMRNFVDEIGFTVHKEATKGISNDDIENLKKSLFKIWQNLEKM